MTERKKEYHTRGSNIQSGKRHQSIKEEPIHKITYAGQYGTKSKKRHKDQNCRYCDAPNWNPNHKCPACDA